MQPDDGSSFWAWNFNNGLVCLYLSQGLICIDSIPLLDQPFDYRSFLYAFSYIRELEFVCHQ